jgi:hypothetical protein
MKFIVSLLSLFVVLQGSAFAHKASDAYVSLEPGNANSPAQIQLSVALRDLDRALDSLDANHDRAITAGEVKAAMPQITGLAQQSIALRCAGRSASLTFSLQAIEQRSDGSFLRLAAPWEQASACELKTAQIRYTLMQGIDADHRAILSLNLASQASSQVLAPGSDWQDLVQAQASGLNTIVSFIRLGVGHISAGADHVAFVICLVLGLVLMRDWRNLLMTITAFTLGHSITLIAATLGWVGSPVWVEPMIAASIGLTAALNLIKHRAAWMQTLALKASLAAGFGLVHGLGFSGAMAQAKVPADALPWALAGFNIGVEIGQLLIIGLWCAVYFALRNWAGYTRWVLQGGSVLLIGLSVFWILERIGVFS